jgi:hypothetical protein
MKKTLTLFSPEILEKDVLYIIGNGFDIAHNIESKYSDFERWCRDTNKNTSIFDCLFSTQIDFWSNIENALGSYNEDAILDFCKPDEEFDLDHSLSSSARIEDAPMSILKPALDELNEYFVEWVDSISLVGVNDFLRLYKNAKYLTFNYTETLEKIYSISEKNICHIHGSRLFKNKYILGHNNYRDTNSYGDDLPFFEENAYLSIFEYLNEYHKPFKEIIHNKADFFSELHQTKLVYVLGHALSEIDMPYFDHLLSLFVEQPKFVFSANSDNDCQSIDNFVKNRKIAQYKIIEINDLI